MLTRGVTREGVSDDTESLSYRVQYNSNEGEGGARVHLGSSSKCDHHWAWGLPSERVKGRLGRLAGLQAAAPPGGTHSAAPRQSYAKLEQRRHHVQLGKIQAMLCYYGCDAGPPRGRALAPSDQNGDAGHAHSRCPLECLIYGLLELILRCSASAPATSLLLKESRSTPESDLASEHHDSTVA